MLRKLITPLLLVLPIVMLVVAAGCTHTAPPVTVAPPSAIVATPVAVVNEYVGSEACGKCHTAEWNSHRKTHHAHTFRPMTVAALGKLAPPQTLFSDANCAVAISGGDYVLVNPQNGKTRPLQYALGSGKQGLTFIAMEAENTIFEMRKSYIPRTHEWYATPGQERLKPGNIGQRWSSAISRKCVLCHAVMLSEYRSYPDPQFMGVGCESCHGPGSAHIAAINAGKTDIAMAKLDNIGGKRINTLCGACHRTPEDVAAMPAKERLTQRFMPYGLAQSRCFQQSGDHLSCITCHNPHADASTDPRVYERVCLSCHTKTPTSAVNVSSPLPATSRRIVCPVNPRSGCIACHMPTKKLSGSLNKIPIAMADHWIRVQRP